MDAREGHRDWGTVWVDGSAGDQPAVGRPLFVAQCDWMREHPWIAPGGEGHDGQCPNCGAPLGGRFCHQCGQRDTTVLMSARAFVVDAVQEYLGVDGKIVRTMKVLLVAPGRLTTEMVAGRRARYLSPVRLYLFWSLIFFGLWSLAGGSSGQAAKKRAPVPDTAGASVGAPGATPAEASTWAARLKRAGDRLKADDASVVEEKLALWWPTVMFGMVPVFGGLVWLFHRRRGPPFYLPHLYFAIHVHVFFFVAFFAFLVIRTGVPLVTGGFRVPGRWLSPVLLAAVMFHLIAALRRVYGDSWAGAIARALAMVVLYLAAMLLATSLFAVGMLLVTA